MVEIGYFSRFVQESLEHIGLLSVLARECLQGHFASQLPMFGNKNSPQIAAPESLTELVLADPQGKISRQQLPRLPASQQAVFEQVPGHSLGVGEAGIGLFDLGQLFFSKQPALSQDFKKPVRCPDRRGLSHRGASPM